MKRKLTFVAATLTLLAILIAPLGMKGQVSSATPANGQSYVVAAYAGNKYWALPNGTVNGGKIQGVEVTLNSLNKVSTSDAVGKTWTLEQGSTAGRYYIKYTSGGDTYYLYKNGTSSSNHNFAVNKTSKNYWEFTANTSGAYTGYNVKAIDRGSNNLYIYCTTAGTFSCDASFKIILLEVGDDSTPTNYTISTNVTPSGAGSVSGAGSYASGTNCTLTATANSGYTFSQWQDGNTDNPRTITVTGDATYTATFTEEGDSDCTTLVFSTLGYSDGESVDEEKIAIGTASTVTFYSGTNSNAPKYYSTGEAIRAYGGNYFTVASNSLLITSITLTYGNGGNTNEITADVGTLSNNNSWTGSASSVTFTVGGTTGHRRISSIKVCTEEPTTYTINATANPNDGGSITGQGFNNGSGTYNEGSTCALTATANTGYIFVNWTENGQQVSTNATYSFTVTGDRTLVANFTTAYTVSASANPTAGGTVAGAGTFASGSNVTLTATANTGYTFTNWTENGSVITDAGATYTFTVNANRTLVANFTLNSYTIGATASPTAGGSVTGGGTYNHGASCTLTASPNEGYVFTRWTKNGSPVSTNASYTFNVTEDASYVAVFTPTYTVSATVDPTNSGTITGTGTFTQGASCTLLATANTNYRFANWTENGTVVSNSASYTISNITADHTLVAHFTRTYAITATTSPAGSGEITGTGYYASGESCTLTVAPAAGHNFINWTKDGQVVSTDNPYTFTVNEAAAYVANFTVESYTVSVAASPSSGGTVSGGDTYDYGQSCTVTATANSASGFEFINWTEDGTPVSSDATYTFTVTGDRDLVANFGIPCDYELVTESQTDWTGDYVLTYVDGSTAKVLTGKASDNYGAYTTATISSNAIATSAVSSYNIEIAQVTYQNSTYYTLKQGEYYLGLTAASNNLYFSTTTGTAPQYYWTISYTNNTLYITSASFSGRRIQWNNSSPRFACYTGTQKEISLFKKGVCGPTCPVPTNLAVNNITGNSASISWTGDAESYNLRYRTITTSQTTGPVTEDFSNQTAVGYSATNGQLPDGWTSYNSSSSGYAPRVSNSSSYTYISALTGNFLLMTTNATGQKAYVILQQYNNCTALSFNYAFENTSNCGDLEVGYVTNNTGYSTFTSLQTISVADTQSHSFTMPTSDINTINSNNGYIAFKYNSGSANFYSVGIDNVTVTYTQTTETPGSWMPNDYGTSATSPYALNNLSTATTYEVQVQSECEEGLESDWSDGVTFTTLSGYTLSTSVTPQVGGTISANGTTISGDVTYAPGTPVELTAVAATGYTFQTWVIDGSPYQGNPANVTMDQNHTVATNFTINTYSYTATAMPQAGGVMRLNGGEPEDYIWGQNDYGTQLSFEAIANEGYHFVNWTEDGVLTDQATYAFTLEDNRSLAANFAINSYAVTIEANPSQGGTLSGDASDSYNHGATVTVTATPSTGYHFVNWTVDGTEVSTNATLSGYAITSACTIRANFEIDSYAVTIEANPTVGGAVSGYASGNYDYGTTITVNATANPGYHFVNWTVDGAEESTSTTLSYVITSTCTVSANFEPDTFEISTSVAPENSGSVEGAGTYDYNSTCTLTATPNVGYTFVNWTKNGVGVSNNATYSFTVTADASYVANFQRNSYSITVSAMPSNGGIATGAGTYNHGVSVTVNATPNAGYQFVNWTVNGNEVSTSASYTFTATEALNLVANFLYAVVPPTVATNSQVNNVTGSSAQCGGQITSTGYGYISAYGFCWNTTGEPTIQDSHYQVGISTTDPFTYNITGLNANTLYYVRAYATNQEGTAYGNEVTFATMAQVTTAAVTAHTLDAIMGGSWVSGSGNATVTACGVEYKEATASTWQTASMSVPASGTSFSGTVSGLTANTDYVVRAYVTNGGGTSYGTEVPFTTIGYFAVSATVNPAEAGTVSFDPEGDGQGSAAKTVTIGNGNDQQGFYPINNGFAHSFDEMIYPGGGEMTAGNITQISFRIGGSSSSSSFNVDVYLKTVGNTTAFTNGQPIEFTSNDKYYSGAVTASKNAEWVTIALAAPFTYNGTDNILVGIDYNGGTGELRNWYATTTNAVTSLSFYGDSNINPTVYPIVSDFSIYNFGEEFCMQRPNIQFTIEAAGANTQWYSWGSTPELTAEPATGYQFLNWTENGQVVSTDNPYTLESIEADRNLVANFVICKTFTNADGDHDWDNAANWVPAGVPNGEDVVIAAAATISDGTVATVDNITISNGSITIEDGGQLKHNNSGVTVTTQKSITGYGSANAQTNKGYYLISSPVNNMAISDVTGLQTSQHYDLYKFVSNNEENGELLEWMHVNGNLEAKTGYIYASEETTTLGITGTVAHSATDIEKTLTYNEGFRFGGWNLVGNPFVCDAYVDVANYYILSHQSGYDEFVATDNTHAIAPMSGLMVVATAANQSVTFSRTVPSKGSGILNMDVRKTVERGIATLDRARVRFGEGTNLEKFQFDTRHTKISIPEGSNEYSVYYADGAGTIPVNFKAQDNGRYTLDFSTEEIGFNYLHLIDNMNGNDVNLLETPYYAFDAKSTDFASRFTLVFATGNNDGESTFAFFNNGNWIINNDGKAELQVVDALGRILSSETISGSCSKAINVAPGVYMLRLINGNDVKVQKIVVRR